MRFFVVLLVLAFVQPLKARADLAPGFQLGDPTGFTLKSYKDQRHAFDFGLSYSLNHFMTVYADVLWQWPLNQIWGKRKKPDYPIYFYFGAGGIIFVSTDSNRRDAKYFTTSGDSLGMGIRVPLGLETRLDQTPFTIYVEGAPGVGIIPGTFGFMQFGFGGRIHL